MRLVLVLCAALLVVACSEDTEDDEGAGVPTATATTATQPRPVRLARADAAKRARVSAGKIRVVGVTRKTWSDSCLGVRTPDVLCAQVITTGYRVTFSVRGERVIYHTDRRSSFVRAPR